MPATVYVLVSLFLASSVLVGIVAVRLVARIGGPRLWIAYVLPILAGFGAFYQIGHRWGIVIGPEFQLFGFRVALLGDLAIGFVAALGVAVVQGLVTRVVRAVLVRRTGDAQRTP